MPTGMRLPSASVIPSSTESLALVIWAGGGLRAGGERRVSQGVRHARHAGRISHDKPGHPVATAGSGVLLWQSSRTKNEFCVRWAHNGSEIEPMRALLLLASASAFVPQTSRLSRHVPSATSNVETDPESVAQWFSSHQHESFAMLASADSPAALAGLVSPAEGDAPAEPLDITEGPMDDADRALIGDVLNYLQMRLVNQGADDDDEGDDALDDDEDFSGETGFIAEGRRLLAVKRFHIVRGADEAEAWRRCWDELSYLATTTAIANIGPDDEGDGALVLMPDFVGDARAFALERLVAGACYLGVDSALTQSGDEPTAALEVQGFRVAKGAPCPFVRIVAGVGTAPDDAAKEAT